MQILKIRGIVLKEIILKESDKIIILLSKDYGKINTSAKGARNHKSKIFAGTQAFTYGDFILHKTKKYFYIKEVSIIKKFSNIIKDYDKICYGNYFLEIVEKLILEDQECNEILKLLIKTLNILDKDNVDNKLITSIFHFKVTQYSGYEPIITNCINCNKNINNFENLYFTEEGIICDICIKIFKSRYLNISYTSLYAINFILKNNINEIFKFNLEKTILDEFYNISTLFLFNLDLNLKSKKFINNNI